MTITITTSPSGLGRGWGRVRDYFGLRTSRMNPVNCFSISCNLNKRSVYISSLIYPIFFEMSSCVSTSYELPKAVSRNLAKSASEGFAEPSAILLLIDTTARCSWSHCPFFSNLSPLLKLSLLGFVYFPA